MVFFFWGSEDMLENMYFINEIISFSWMLKGKNDSLRGKVNLTFKEYTHSVSQY